MDTVKIKRCSKCLLELPITNFIKHRRVCKPCMSIKKKQYRIENIEKIRKRDREYAQRPEVRERRMISIRKYYSKPEKIEKQKQYKNRPDIRAKKSIYDREYKIRKKLEKELMNNG